MYATVIPLLHEVGEAVTRERDRFAIGGLREMFDVLSITEEMGEGADHGISNKDRDFGD